MGFDGLGKYKVILSDCPWTFKVYSKKGEGRSARQHYSVMDLDEIKALPVAQLADDDCCLFLWATDPLLPQALEVIDSWHFTFKTIGFYWVKTNKKSPGFFTGLGYYTRANCELCLLATRGHPKRLNKGVKKLVIAPRREHSEKPEEIQDRIEVLMEGPRIELFARRQRLGWTCLGDELGQKFSPLENE